MPRNLYRVRILILAVLAQFALQSTVLSTEFFPLGDLGGPNFSSEAQSVSSDGTTVVGASANIQDEAFIWNENTGMTGIGPGYAASVSLDGSTIIGGGFFAPSVATEPFRWNSSTGFRPLGNPTTGLAPGPSAAADVSADGSVIVGWQYFDSKLEAFRWTEAFGYQRLGDLHNGSGSSVAQAVSADGTTVVGQSTGPGPDKIFRWTATSGIEDLSDLAGESAEGAAVNVSADGSTIVGFSSTGPGFEAYTWNESIGLQFLGHLESSHAFSISQATTGDGKVVVGYSGQNGLANTANAFFWTESGGMQSLQTYLEGKRGLGAALDGWSLSVAYDISPDGRHIVGRGYNPNGDVEAWLVRLSHPIQIPEPTSHCLGLFGVFVMFFLRNRTTLIKPNGEYSANQSSLCLSRLRLKCFPDKQGQQK